MALKIATLNKYNISTQDFGGYIRWQKTKEVWKEVEKEIKKLHPYDVPEIFAEEIKEGLNEYLEWIEKETK